MLLAILFSIIYQILLHFNAYRISNINDANYVRRMYLSACLCSFINALIVTSISIYSLISADDTDIFYQHLQNMNLTTDLLIGYFISDTMYLVNKVYKTKKIAGEDILYFAYHLMFYAILQWFNTVNKYHYLVFMSLLMEASTIFANISMYFRYYAKYFSSEKHNLINSIIFNILAQLSFIIFAILFFVTRFVIIFYLMIKYFNLIYCEEPIIFAFATFIITLNTVWFKKICNMVIHYKWS